jgi:hypothetical protein
MNATTASLPVTMNKAGNSDGSNKDISVLSINEHFVPVEVGGKTQTVYMQHGSVYATLVVGDQIRYWQMGWRQGVKVWVAQEAEKRLSLHRKDNPFGWAHWFISEQFAESASATFESAIEALKRSVNAAQAYISGEIDSSAITHAELDLAKHPEYWDVISGMDTNNIYVEAATWWAQR